MKIKSIINNKKNKKGQAISIIFFFVIILSVLILAVIIMSLVNTVLEPFRDSIATLPEGNESATRSVEKIQTSFNSVWDWAIAFLFLFNLIILLFSSFMVDIHPAFLLIYIISVMFLLMFGSTIVGALNDIYSQTGVFGTGNVTAGGNAISNMPISSWLLNNFTLVMLGIIILSGVIMYAKFKFGNSEGGNY